MRTTAGMRDVAACAWARLCMWSSHLPVRTHVFVFHVRRVLRTCTHACSACASFLLVTFTFHTAPAHAANFRSAHKFGFEETIEHQPFSSGATIIALLERICTSVESIANQLTRQLTMLTEKVAALERRSFGDLAGVGLVSTATKKFLQTFHKPLPVSWRSNNAGAQVLCIEASG